MNATEKQITFINSLMNTLKSKDGSADYLYWLNLADFSHLTDKQASRLINLLKSNPHADMVIDGALDNSEVAALFGKKATVVIAFMNAALEKGIQFDDMQTVWLAYESEQRAADAPEGATVTAERCQENIDYAAKYVKAFQSTDQLSKLLKPESKQRGLQHWQSEMQHWQRGKAVAEAFGRYFPLPESFFATSK